MIAFAIQDEITTSVVGRRSFALAIIDLATYISGVAPEGTRMDTAAIIRPEMQARLLSIMRIMVGLLYLQSGTGKFLNIPVVPSFATLTPSTMSWWGGVVETICGPLIVLGLFTRPAAFIAAGKWPSRTSGRTRRAAFSRSSMAVFRSSHTASSSSISPLQAAALGASIGCWQSEAGDTGGCASRFCSFALYRKDEPACPLNRLARRT